MGCITGFVAKIFLTGFNIVVTLTGAAVLALAAIVATIVNRYEDLVPTDIHQILDALQSVSPLVMCLGLFGVLVACCCSNKLFLYTYFILGCCLVVATLTVAGIGTNNMNNGHYREEIKTLMFDDLNDYDLNNHGENETKRDNLYHELECCGVDSFEDWGKYTTLGSHLPPGCCKEYPEVDECTAESSTTNVFIEGCYAKLKTDAGEIAAAAVKLAIFFGVLLFALLTSTCLCVKCTEAMPI